MLTFNQPGLMTKSQTSQRPVANKKWTNEGIIKERFQSGGHLWRMLISTEIQPCRLGETSMGININITDL